jgi:hypothetical protein
MEPPRQGNQYIAGHDRCPLLGVLRTGFTTSPERARSNSGGTCRSGARASHLCEPGRNKQAQPDDRRVLQVCASAQEAAGLNGGRGRERYSLKGVSRALTFSRSFFDEIANCAPEPLRLPDPYSSGRAGRRITPPPVTSMIESPCSIGRPSASTSAARFLMTLPYYARASSSHRQDEEPTWAKTKLLATVMVGQHCTT